MFRSTLRSSVHAAVASALLAVTAAPIMAQEGRGPPPGPQGQGQPPQPQKKKHHSGVGAAIGAGVIGGLVGGAILGSQGQAAPGYPPPPGYDAPPPPPPRYGPPPAAYDAEADDEPVCHLVRRPVYDEDGQVVDYRTRRVCR